MADLANIAVASAAAAAVTANPGGQVAEKKFNVCDWNNLNCCDVYHRVNIIISALFIVATVGGAAVAGSGITIVQSAAIAYGIWGAYVGILSIVYTVKYLELGGMVHQTNRLRTEVNDLEGEVNQLESTNDGLLTLSRSLEERVNQLTSQIGSLENTNKELTDQVEKLNNQVVEFDRLIHQFSSNFQIHDKTLVERMEGINKASKNLEEGLKKITSVFNLALKVQNESSEQLKFLQGSVALLGRGVTDFDKLQIEQKKLIEKEVDLQEKMERMLKRQEKLTTELENITSKFNKARPMVLSLAAQLLFYKREYQKLKNQ